MRLTVIFPFTVAGLLFFAVFLQAADTPGEPALKAALLETTTRHLNALLDSEGKIKPLKGKSAGAAEALAFQLMFEITGEKRFRDAALDLADHELADMRATTFGVRAIKEK